MPEKRIPLVGVNNQRSIDGEVTLIANKDQQFTNCLFDLVKNPVTGIGTVYVEKRPGWSTMSLVAAGSASTGLLRTEAVGAVVSAFGETNSTVYDSTNSVGTITGRAIHFSETSLAGSTVGYVLIRSSDGTAWYYASDAGANTAYTANGNNSTTISNIKIGGSNSTAGLYPGQKLTAASNGITGSRIVSVNAGAFTAVLDTATTGGAFTDLAITKEPIAKITSANFVTTGTKLSAFVTLDGYVFYCTEDGYVYHSDLNTIIAYTAANKIAADSIPDMPVAIGLQSERVLCFGKSSIEAFVNAGYPAGSVLSKAGSPKRIGIQDQRSLAALKDDLYFVSSSSDGNVQVMRMRGLQLEPVSTPAIDKIISAANATGCDIYANCYELGGYPYLQLTILGAEATSYSLLEDDSYVLHEDGGKRVLEFTATDATNMKHTLIYNIKLNIWSEFTGTLGTFVRGMGSSNIGQLIATSRVDTSGKIYTINPSSASEVYADDGTNYSMVIRTSKLDLGTSKRKFIARINLIADTETSGTVTLECNDGDYDSGSWVTLGTFDMTQDEKFIHGCGSHLGGRAYRMTHSANAHFRAEALVFNYTV